MKGTYLFLICALLSLGACKMEVKRDDDRSERSRDNEPAEDDAIGQLQKLADNLKDGKRNETVEFEKLEAVIPEKLNGYKRESIEGSKTGMLGFSVSNVTSTFSKNGEDVEITITDTGNLGIASAMASWTQLEFSRRDKNGFERTAEFNGDKCFEKFDKNGRSEFAVFYANRYLVTAGGRVDDFDDLRDMIEDIKLRKLPKE